MSVLFLSQHLFLLDLATDSNQAPLDRTLFGFAFALLFCSMSLIVCQLRADLDQGKRCFILFYGVLSGL